MNHEPNQHNIINLSATCPSNLILLNLLRSFCLDEMNIVYNVSNVMSSTFFDDHIPNKLSERGVPSR